MEPKDRTPAAEAILADEERARSPLTKHIETIANFLSLPSRVAHRVFPGSVSATSEMSIAPAPLNGSLSNCLPLFVATLAEHCQNLEQFLHAVTCRSQVLLVRKVLKYAVW